MKRARVIHRGEQHAATAEDAGLRLDDGRFVREDEVAWLAPLEPRTIFAVGLNYAEHAREIRSATEPEPLVFLKGPNAIAGHRSRTRRPGDVGFMHYECELAVVIGKTAARIRPEEAGDFIFGYTCFNDVTARELQKLDGQWTRAKGFDTFAPAGPWIVTDLDPRKLSVESYLNGERRQSGNTADLIFPVEKLVSFISQIMTLYPGDLISTGTPSGIGPMKPGDRIEIVIDGIGRLKNRVV